MKDNLVIVKRFLSITLDELSKNNIRGINACNWEDRKHQHAKDTTYRCHIKKEKSPFTGLIIHAEGKKEFNKIESRFLTFNALGLGAEIIASTYRSIILIWLVINTN